MPRPADPSSARDARPMSAAQRAYEEKRAAAAGLSLDAWLARKRRRDAPPPPPARPAKKPGLISRWLDRAHKPL